MDDRNTKHLNKERLCYCCDKLQPSAESLHIFRIEDRGYGSKFDDSDFKIQLCDICKNHIDPIWFNEEFYLAKGYCEIYKYEDEVIKFIDTWIFENQEYVYNEEDYYKFMTRQDWIDYKKGILPDEKIENYGLYSLRQAKAYEEKFTTCNYPINIKDPNYIDGCKCQFGANGDYDQKISQGYHYTDCFYCQNYVKRFEPIKEMDMTKYKRYVQYLESKEIYLILNNIIHSLVFWPSF